jgi:hypothetical protein
MDNSKHFTPDAVRFDSLTGWRKREAAKYRADVNDDTRVYDDAAGIRRWRSNDSVVPPMVLRDACLVPSATHEAAYTASMHRTLAAYRGARATCSPEQRAEAAFEARAAFGPGVALVNVLTGERSTS